MTITVRWLGHSAFQANVNGKWLLIDPFLKGNPGVPSDIVVDEIQADFILLTHAHGDHLGDAAEIALRTNATIISIWEIYEYMRFEKKVNNLHPQNIGGEWEYDDFNGRVKFVRADHSSSFPTQNKYGRYAGQACGIILRTEGKCLYFAGDTALFAEMRQLRRYKIDIAFLPIGDNFTMGIEDSIEAIKLIRPRRVFPTHYTKPGSRESQILNFIEQDPRKWEKCVRGRLKRGG